MLVIQCACDMDPTLTSIVPIKGLNIVHHVFLSKNRRRAHGVR